MAAAEAMAFGLPAVGFNLKSFKSYYPQGMVKVEVGQTDVFAEEILNLLDKPGIRGELGEKAKTMIEENWSWDKRAQEIFKQITA
jgi:glycosyltransferase involved in cell wall biosynthesis